MINIDKETLHDIINYYGKARQVVKALEEMAELSVEVAKQFNNGNDVRKITEEMADVYVMLAQLQEIYKIDDREIEHVIKYKLNRTLERMKNGA